MSEQEVRKTVRTFMAQLERLARKDNPGGRYGSWSANTLIGRICATELRPGYTRVRLVWDHANERCSRKSIESYFVAQLMERETENSGYIKSIQRQTENLAGFKP